MNPFEMLLCGRRDPKPPQRKNSAVKGTREGRLPKVDSPWGLTPTECYILAGLAEGKELTEVAGELCISIKTASTYRVRASEKMESRSGIHAVVMWDRFARGQA